MREAIERVIADLHKRIDHADEMAKYAAEQRSLYREGMNQGRADAWAYVINQLNEVLSYETGDTRDTSKPE